MTTPKAELLAQVATLNDPANPFTYEVVGDTIVGSWDIVSARTLYPTEFATIDKKFSVTITLDEGKGTFKSKDRSSESTSSVSGGGMSFGTKSFSGQESSKGFSFEFGGASKTKDGVSPVVAYSWDTSKIKDPLFSFLEGHGYKRKKGLFG